MILNGNTIKKLMEAKNLIENANLENIRSSSYDLTATDEIISFKKKKEPISLIDAETLTTMYKTIKIEKEYELQPNESILIPISDLFNMPDNICAHVRGRTSFNRLGLNISNQHINPGYKGKLNITLTNNSPNTYRLTPNMRIAQVVFEALDNNVSKDLLYYNEKNPMYQNEDGTRGSKIYADYIGKVVRHFKGNYYYIENICLDSESKEYTIIYRTLYNREDSNIWTRPAKMFFETIDENRPDNKTKQKHRFEIVDSLTIDYTKKGEEK